MAKRRRVNHTRERIKDLFDLHRDERRGVQVLMTIMLILVVVVVYEQWLRPPKEHDMTVMRKRMEDWLVYRSKAQADTGSVHLFPFDPNAIGREEWRALGLSNKQVDGIERYQAKGGRFRTKKDLGRMYSLRPEQYAKLHSFILLPDSLPPRSPQKHKGDRPEREPLASHTTDPGIRERATYEPRSPRAVEINTADTTALVAMPGIGPAFARSMVKYRDALGGFHSLDQLSEVYILKDKPDAVLQLKRVLTIDTLMVRRIPINTCTVEELAAHPYARWKVAKPLIAYRNQHGPFNQLADIKGCVLVTEEVFRKLAPYLSVE